MTPCSPSKHRRCYQNSGQGAEVARGVSHQQSAINHQPPYSESPRLGLRSAKARISESMQNERAFCLCIPDSAALRAADNSQHRWCCSDTSKRVCKEWRGVLREMLPTLCGVLSRVSRDRGLEITKMCGVLDSLKEAFTPGRPPDFLAGADYQRFSNLLEQLAGHMAADSLGEGQGACDLRRVAV